jgi:hypothetical protein
MSSTTHLGMGHPTTWLRRNGRAPLLAFAVLAVFATLAAKLLLAPFRAQDFFALWSYGQILIEHSGAELYDSSRLQDLQVALGMDPAIHAPFPYPPVFMLLVWPLGLVPLGPAFHLWTALTLAAFVMAAAPWGGRLPAAVLPLALLLLSPLTTASVVAGQSGFLSGALLIGGLRLAERRPWLAGVLLSLLTYKPQLGLLVPVALVAAGAWRAAAAAGLMAAAMAAVACAMFGPQVWMDWLASLPAYAGRFEGSVDILQLQPTVTAGLALAGVPHGLANLVQAASACAMAGLVWFACRGGLRGPAIAVVVGATFLATPHAFFYDMPMLTAAVLLVGRARWWDGTLRVPEAAFLVLALCSPVAMVESGLPLCLPVLLGFTLWAAWPLVRRGARQSLIPLQAPAPLQDLGWQPSPVTQP